MGYFGFSISGIVTGYFHFNNEATHSKTNANYFCGKIVEALIYVIGSRLLRAITKTINTNSMSESWTLGSVKRDSLVPPGTAKVC